MSTLILVADDNPFNLRLLQELCEAAGYRVISAGDGGQVLDMVARERPSLILLDVGMPVLDGFEVTKILKADAALSRIPVILVTSAGDIEARSRGIELGADDYVTKPYMVFEIHQRIRNVLRVHAAESAAISARQRASENPPFDSTTSAGTSRQLVITLDYELTRAERFGHPLTCMLVRIENFEDIVALAGQQTGESLLTKVASGLRGCIRVVDHLFRYDVDEFALLLTETGPEGGETVLVRVRGRVSDQSLWGGEIEPVPRIRAGCASWPACRTTSVDEFLRATKASQSRLE